MAATAEVDGGQGVAIPPTCSRFQLGSAAGPKVGNLTDDAEHYEYVWDVFGRLRKVKDTSDQCLVAEYRYNGVG